MLRGDCNVVTPVKGLTKEEWVELTFVKKKEALNDEMDFANAEADKELKSHGNKFDREK